MNILIIGPSWVGDMVMAQTLFQCLKQRHPECEIDVLAPDWSRPILERMPEVRQLCAVSGEFDYVGLLRAESAVRLNSLLDEIRNLEGVVKTTTSVALAWKIERT